jgi:hypothetical protein
VLVEGHAQVLGVLAERGMGDAVLFDLAPDRVPPLAGLVDPLVQTVDLLAPLV